MKGEGGLVKEQLEFTARLVAAARAKPKQEGLFSHLSKVLMNFEQSLINEFESKV